MGITKKQKEVLDYVSEYYMANDYSPTQEEIRDQFQLKSLGSVQRYIKYLITAGYLEKTWNARRGLKPASISSPTDHFTVPLLGNVAAGNPISAIENHSGTVAIPDFIKTSRESFALKVQGDSMIEDGIFEGDTIICDTTIRPKNGDTVVAIIEEEATVKRYKKHKSSIELIPANSTMSPIKITTGSFRIAGIVTGLIRSI